MLWLFFLPVALATFLALALLEVAFYLLIIANIFLLFADLLMSTIRQPNFALAACVASLVCLSFPLNIATAMLLAGEISVVAAVRFARDHPVRTYIIAGLVGLSILRGTFLLASFLEQLWRDW